MNAVAPELSPKSCVKALLNTWAPLKVAAYMVHDQWCRLKLKLGHIGSGGGTRHSSLSLPQSVAYVEGVFARYKQIGGFERFHGSCAEIGPGDSAGVAMLMRRDGAAQVDLVDRYCSHSDPRQQEAIYRALAKSQHGPASSQIGPWLDGISWNIGTPAEEYFRRCAQLERQYDFIVSKDVLEHLYDPLSALGWMTACLRPGGLMVHVIDLQDHGLFAPRHPLTFLRVPTPVYRAMTRHSGRPNRVLWSDYRAAMEALVQRFDIDWELFATNLVGSGSLPVAMPLSGVSQDLLDQAVAEARSFMQQHRLARPFRSRQPEELAVDGCALVVRRRS